MASGPTENFNLVSCQLKWSLLKLNAFAWCVTKEESKVNVHDVPLNVDEDVSVVSVFYLENIAQQRIGSETLAKVLSGLFEVLLLWELHLKVVDNLGVLAHLLLD